MNQQVEQFSVFVATIGGIGLALSPIINGLINSIKETGLVPTKYLTLLAWFIGVLIGLLISLVTPIFGDELTLTLSGLVGGLIATKNYNKIANDVYTKTIDKEE